MKNQVSFLFKNGFFPKTSSSIDTYFLGEPFSRFEIANVKFSLLNKYSHHYDFGKTEKEIEEIKTLLNFFIKYLINNQ